MNKQKFVYQQAAEMSRTLGIPVPEIHFKSQEHFRLGHAWGRCNWDRNEMIIRTHGRTLKSIRRTIAHELIHIAFKTKVKHGVRFEQYVDALLKGHLVFNGRGLYTEIVKPGPSLEHQITVLQIKEKKLSTKIKRLETSRKKLKRKIHRLGVKIFDAKLV